MPPRPTASVRARSTPTHEADVPDHEEQGGSVDAQQSRHHEDKVFRFTLYERAE